MRPKRPTVNPKLQEQQMQKAMRDLEDIKSILESHEIHARRLNLRRLSGVGIATQGFMERAGSLADDCSEFLPRWLAPEKYREDLETYNELRKLFDLSAQVSAMIWNHVRVAGDIASKNAQEFYKIAQEAQMRGIDPAEAVMRELAPFYKARGKRDSGELTRKKLIKDANGIIDGTIDGKIILEHESPKLEEGKSEAIVELE